MASKRKRFGCGKVSNVTGEFLSQISEIENYLRKALVVKDKKISKVLEEKHQRETELADLYGRIETEIKKWRKTMEDENKKHNDLIHEKNIALVIFKIENEEEE